MQQDTGKFRKNTNDQYYTKESVAKECIKILIEKCPELLTNSYQWIEPSAGNGVFINAIPSTIIDKVGIELQIKSQANNKFIQQGDFLNWTPTSDKKRIFFGNPPFGRQGSLAKSFIQHSAKYADYIAFILPRSFVKPSMLRAFPLQFHCIYSNEIEKNAFEVNGEVYDVPCVFQIWKKQIENRTVPLPSKEVGFTYVKSTDKFNIAFRRVGGLAGKCYKLESEINKEIIFSQQSHYFWKLDEKYIPHIDTIIKNINQHIFPSNTVGPRSLSKSEANDVMNGVLSKISFV